MRWLALCFALLLLVGSLFLFVGGLGPLMWFGDFGEHFIGEHHWAWNLWVALAYGFVAVWLSGVVCCIAQPRHVLKAIGSALERSSRAADYVVYLGHLALIGSLINFVWLKFGARDFVYGYLLVAALLYSIGLGLLALTFRPESEQGVRS
jgi:hypothetical protein